MDVLMLCSGYGKRLEDLTKFGTKDYTPKGLLKIRGVPCIEYSVRNVGQIKDVDRIIYVTNNEGKQKYTEWLRTLPKVKRYKLIVEPFSTPERSFGVAATINYSILEESISNELLIIAPDNLFGFPLGGLVDFHRKKQANAFPVHCMRNYQKLKQHANIIYDKDKRVLVFKEKPKQPISNMINTFCFLLLPRTYKKLDRYLRKYKKTDRFGDFMESILDDGLYAYAPNALWIDIGSIEEFRRANKINWNKYLLSQNS